jgi:hypothetical protein
MNVVTGWTGRTACALQDALRMSSDTFAAHLDVSVRTVADWHKNLVCGRYRRHSSFLTPRGNGPSQRSGSGSPC